MLIQAVNRRELLKAAGDDKKIKDDNKKTEGDCCDAVPFFDTMTDFAFLVAGSLNISANDLIIVFFVGDRFRESIFGIAENDISDTDVIAFITGCF